MKLPDRLCETTLGDVLATLHRSYATGVLELLEEDRGHAVHFRRGLVQAVETSAMPWRLGDLLVASGCCLRECVEQVARDAHTCMPRIGQRLVSRRVVSSGQRDEALAKQRRRRLEALFGLRDATLRFVVARPLPPGSAEQPPMCARETFHHRKRHRDRGGCSAWSSHWSRATALAVLGLCPDATNEEIRRRYRERVRALHPDLSTAPTEAECVHRVRELRAVLDAYRSLCG